MLPGPAPPVVLTRLTPLTGLHPAVRLGAVVLGVITSLVAGAWVLLPVAGLLIAGLAWTGFSPRALARAARPWLPILLAVLIVHTVTHTEFAPLGRPSWPGLLRGCLALVRLGCSLGFLAIYQRVSSLDDLILGVRWWLAPGRLLRLPVDDLGLVLAVTLGTVPVAMAEGRRIESVLRLRSSGAADLGTAGPDQQGPRHPLRRSRLGRLRDRVRLLVPLLESLGRRADNLSLTLQSRRPGGELELPRPPLGQVILLLAWLAVLVLLCWGLGGGG